MKSNPFRYWHWIALAIIILFVASIRIRLLQVPLERDEGEFAYMGQLMLEGIPPYSLAYNMKLPGIYAAYALIMAFFGQTIAGIHFGLLLVNASSVLLLYFLTRRLFSNTAGVVASASYALLSLSPGVLGTSAHATQFIVPLMLGGTIFLSRSFDSGKYRDLFVSGLLYGLAFLMKQHAAFFIAFAFLYFLWTGIQKRPLNLKRLTVGSTILMGAASMPIIITCVLLYVTGVFPSFWFWIFQYGSEYISEVSISDAIEIFRRNAVLVIEPCLWIWVLAAVGLTAIIWDRKVRGKWPFLVGMVAFSFLSICPGLYFRNHYFITFLPIVAMLAGVAISAIQQLFAEKAFAPLLKTIAALAFLAALINTIHVSRVFYFKADPVLASRMLYGLSPFPESIEIAKYIENNTARNERIAVFGSEPQIFFYAKRKSATGYIYVYSLLEVQKLAAKMQRQFIDEIEKAQPPFIIMVNVGSSWFNGRSSDDTIFRWAPTYFGRGYRIAGLVNIFPNGSYRFYWGNEAQNTRPQRESNMYILERIRG